VAREIWVTYFKLLYQYFGGTLMVAQLVEAQRYKPEGPGSIPNVVIGIFH
jgi:hypothetical protein